MKCNLGFESWFLEARIWNRSISTRNRFSGVFWFKSSVVEAENMNVGGMIIVLDVIQNLEKEEKEEKKILSAIIKIYVDFHIEMKYNFTLQNIEDKPQGGR